MPIYMKLDGIPGDSPAPGRAPWIDLETAQLQVRNAVSQCSVSHSSVSHSSVAQEIACDSQCGRHSHNLFLACSHGNAIKSGIIEWVGAYGKLVRRLLLRDVYVVHYRMSARLDLGRLTPFEQFALSFAEIENFTYGQWHDHKAQWAPGLFGS